MITENAPVWSRDLGFLKPGNDINIVGGSSDFPELKPLTIEILFDDTVQDGYDVNPCLLSIPHC